MASLALPVDSFVVSIKICENCRRNFFRCQDSREKTCCFCQAMLETSGNQLWRCLDCGCERAWGTGFPEETRAKILRCVTCVAPREHLFTRVV